VGQVGNYYVVLETEDGFVLMDPHAAHERVLFERFLEDVDAQRLESQSLLLPETVQLRPDDAERVRQSVEALRRMGFGISDFGGDTFVIDALPACFAAAAPRALLIEVAETLESAGARRGSSKWREEGIAKAACRAAVNGRDRLNLEQIERLVVDLARTNMPYTCPHGRPTLIFTSYRELNRKFGKSG
jgi:DNA mismatch repair protein MutL